MQIPEPVGPRFTAYVDFMCLFQCPASVLKDVKETNPDAYSISGKRGADCQAPHTTHLEVDVTNLL